MWISGLYKIAIYSKMTFSSKKPVSILLINTKMEDKELAKKKKNESPKQKNFSYRVLDCMFQTVPNVFPIIKENNRLIIMIGL